MDISIFHTPDGDAVLRAWLNPPPACHAPAPKPLKLPESWTVVSTSTGTVVANAWTGDVPILADGSYSCDLVQVIRLAATTPFYVRG